MLAHISRYQMNLNAQVSFGWDFPDFLIQVANRQKDSPHHDSYVGAMSACLEEGVKKDVQQQKAADRHHVSDQSLRFQVVAQLSVLSGLLGQERQADDVVSEQARPDEQADTKGPDEHVPCHLVARPEVAFC